MNKEPIHLFLISMAALALGAGCNSNNSVPGNCSENASSCSAITPESFVTNLVQLAQSGQIPAAYANTTLAKATTLQPGWFVIWDGETQSYQAVNITQYCESGTGCSGSNSAAAAAAFGIPITTLPTAGINADDFGGSTNKSDGQAAGYVEGVAVEPYTGPSAGSGATFFQSGPSGNIYYSVDGATKDVDLQMAQVESSAEFAKAAAVSSQFQMDFQTALKVTELSNKIQAIGQQAITPADREAIMSQMMGITGVTQDELAQVAALQSPSGDPAVADLLTKVSRNLGMPSVTVLRDRLLPALGVNLN